MPLYQTGDPIGEDWLSFTMASPGLNPEKNVNEFTF